MGKLMGSVVGWRKPKAETSWPTTILGKVVTIGATPGDIRSKRVSMEVHVQTDHGNCLKTCPRMMHIDERVFCGPYMQELTITAIGNFVRTHGCVSDFGP